MHIIEIEITQEELCKIVAEYWSDAWNDHSVDNIEVSEFDDNLRTISFRRKES